jgi:Na+-driven multidrug efflux pump
VAGFGIAFAIEGCSLVCPVVSVAGGYYVLASQAIGAKKYQAACKRGLIERGGF